MNHLNHWPFHSDGGHSLGAEPCLLPRALRGTLQFIRIPEDSQALIAEAPEACVSGSSIFRELNLCSFVGLEPGSQLELYVFRKVSVPFWATDASSVKCRTGRVKEIDGCPIVFSLPAHSPSHAF